MRYRRTFQVALAGLCLLALLPVSRAQPARPRVLRMPADANGERVEAFYYTAQKKVRLADSGVGVVKLRQGVTPAQAGIRPLKLAANHPLAPLSAYLGRARLYPVTTTDDATSGIVVRGADMTRIEYLLPVATVLARPRPGRPAPAAMVMLPTIAARFSARLDSQQIEARAAKAGLTVLRTRRGNVRTLALAQGTPAYPALFEAANRLYETGRADKTVLYAHPEFVPVRRSNAIDDPLFELQWNLDTPPRRAATGADVDIDAPGAWAHALGSATLAIAVIDDAVQIDHPDLRSRFVDGGGASFEGLSGDQSDDPSPGFANERHGTACAGLALASANRRGTRGVAPGCGLIAVRALTASPSQLAEAFRFCADPDNRPETDDGAAVITCSWSWNAYFDAVRDAIDEVAHQGRGGRGTVIVFASGNEGGSIAFNQALGARESVICVGSVNSRGGHVPSSNKGPELEVCAPSSDRSLAGTLRIPTTDLTEKTEWIDPTRGFAGYCNGAWTDNGLNGFGGTSAAAPQVAGVCALILSANQGLHAVQVRAILEHTCTRDGLGDGRRAPAFDRTTGHDPAYGYGRVSAARAVRVALQSRENPDRVWPDHAVRLAVRRTRGRLVLEPFPPAHNADGMLVVAGKGPIAWHPADGTLPLVGQRAGGGRVVYTGPVRALSSPLPPAGTRVAVFLFSSTLRYSWGVERDVYGEEVPEPATATIAARNPAMTTYTGGPWDAFAPTQHTAENAEWFLTAIRDAAAATDPAVLAGFQTSFGEIDGFVSALMAQKHAGHTEAESWTRIAAAYWLAVSGQWDECVDDLDQPLENPDPAANWPQFSAPMTAGQTVKDLVTGLRTRNATPPRGSSPDTARVDTSIAKREAAPNPLHSPEAGYARLLLAKRIADGAGTVPVQWQRVLDELDRAEPTTGTD